MEQIKKKYHYPADLKQDLLEKGIEIIQDKGIDGLTLKSLAGSLGVTSAAMYHHYPDKTALLVAIVEKRLDELKTELTEKAYGPLKNDYEKLLVKASMIFYDFCEEHHEFLALLSGDVIKHWNDYPTVGDRINELFSIPLNAIKEAQGKGLFRAGDGHVLLTMLFSSVYGYSSLMFNTKTDLTASISKEARSAFFEVVFSSINMLKKSSESLKSDMKVLEKSLVNN